MRESDSRSLFVVDVDDTLLKTDVLFEQVLQLCRTSPAALGQAVLAALKGRASLKTFLARNVPLDPALLPYREEVVDLMRAAKNRGDRLVLASATHETAVRAIAAHVGLVDDVLGTSESANLKGSRKLEAIRRSYGTQPFVYVGDSRADLVLWAQARRAVAVNPSASIRRALKAGNVPFDVIDDQARSIPRRAHQIVKQLRLYQWAKNVLIFLPMIAAHDYRELAAWISAVIAFFAFSLAASAVYVLNDLLDLPADRRHERKRTRPFASGALPVAWGFVLIPALLTFSFVCSLTSPPRVAGFVALYLTLNLLYSTWLKRVLAIDVVLLAVMYTLRLLVGGAATETPLSPWMLAFSTFFFFGLALVKRYTELAHKTPKGTSFGRGYEALDGVTVMALGAASSLLSVVILTLYLNSPDALRLYSRPENLWLVTPILLYWLSRLWLLAHRGKVHDDPVVFAFRDPPTWLAGAAFVAVAISSL